MDRIVIVDGVRTPFSKAFTDFNDLPAKDLASVVVSELLHRLSINSNLIDEVIVGTVTTTSDAPNLARVVSLLAGIPESKRAVTVSRNCASGMEAITSAWEKIMVGTNEVVLIAGVESMSNVPLLYRKDIQNFLLSTPKLSLIQKMGGFWSLKSKFFQPIIGLQKALEDPVCGLNMGQTAELLAKDFSITRKDQDEFALESHLRAGRARKFLAEEITAVYPNPKFKRAITDDNGIREQQTLEALAKLKPYFEKGTGTVTAGNSSQLTDGGVALLMMKESKAKELGLPILGFIKSHVYTGLDPKRMGLGPAFAIPQALKKASLKLSDIDLFEINEAFAAQVIACERALNSTEFCKKHLNLSEALGKIDRAKLNVHGGAIALGHPVGATGARLILTLLKEMKRKNLKHGLASLCIGGGQGGCVIVERV